MKNNSLLLSKPLTINFRPSFCVGFLYILLWAYIVVTRHYTALDFVHLGEVWAKSGPVGSWGYDGQFYYQLARDPFEAYRYMDNAPYRYQRIFYPLLVSMLSLGRSVLIPYTMLLVNGVAIVLSVEIMSRLLVRQKFSPWLSLPVGLYFGQAAAFLFDTAEPCALCLVCLGCWLMWQRRVFWAALCMGLAALTRETMVLFAAGYVVYFLLRREWRSAVLLVCVAVVPILLWLFALWRIFGVTGVTFTPPFEQSPFAGLFSFQDAPRKFWLLIVLMFVPTSMSCVLAVRELVCRCWREVARLGIFEDAEGGQGQAQSLRATKLCRRWEWVVLLGIWLANLYTVVFLNHYSYLDLISCGRIASSVVVAGLLYGVVTRNRLIVWCMQYYALMFVLFVVCVGLGVSSTII
jgi:hypothetical protein